MVMDAQDMQSDLLALKRLYGLLKTDGDGRSNSATDLLDEHARSLLKNLLDAATERVLKEHSEFITGQVVASGTISATPLSKFPLTVAEVCQSREKETESYEDRKADGLDITLWKENILRTQWSEPGGVEQLVSSALDTGLGLRKNRCRLCRRNTINHMEPLDETHFYKGPEGIGCVSKEASKAIKYIESCMSALRIRADPLHQVPILEAEEMNQPYWLLKQTSRLAQPNESITSGGPALGNWIMSHYDFGPSQARNFENNLSSQLDPSETSYIAPTWPVTFSTASKMEAPTHSRVAVEEECSRLGAIHFMIPNNSEIVDSSLNVRSILGPHGKNHKKPSELLDFGGKQLDAQHKVGIRKNMQYINSKRASLRKQESDDGTTSDSYSEWTSEQTSGHGSDSEEYSLTGQTGEDMTSSTSWSESGDSSPLSCGRRDKKIEDDDAYSSTSRVESHESISSASFKSMGYSSASKKPGPSRIRKANGKIRTKQKGMWERMKDKMEIIFHHHHHHHHHNGDNKPKMSRNVSLLEHKGKAVNFNRQDEEVYEEKAVEKVKKSMIRGKDQKGHFRGMMEGLLRHVRHSKKSKEVIDKVVKGHHHERQKALNKSHWSKVLQHHRGRKLPNKTRVKLGLGKRKACLKALPDMK